MEDDRDDPAVTPPERDAHRDASRARTTDPTAAHRKFSRSQILQSVAVNVALGSATAVVVLGAPVVSAIVGGVAAGALLAVWFHFRGRRNVAESHGAP